MNTPAILSAQHLLGQYLDHSPLGVIEWDSSMRILSWSAQATRLFGWTEAEVKGKYFDELPLVVEEDLPLLQATAGRLVNGPAAHTATDCRNNRSDGTLLHCRWYHSVNKAENGRELSIVSLVQDMSAQVQQEEALQKLRKRFSLITDSTNDGLWEWDLVQNSIWVNDTYKKTFGYDPTRYPDFYNEWLTRLHPDDKEPFLQSTSRAWDQQAESWSGEFRFRLANGAYGNILQRVYFIYGQNQQLEKAIGIDLDITTLRQTEAALRMSEEKFGRVFRSSPIAISVVNKDTGEYRDVNEAYCRMTGYERDEVVGRLATSLDLFPQEERQRMMALYEAHGCLRNVQAQLRKKNGETIHCLLSDEVVNIGSEVLCITTAQDNSEEVRAVEALQAKDRELELIYNTVEDVIFLLNVEDDGGYRFASVNQTFVKTTGLSPEQVVGKQVAEIIPEPSLSLVLAQYKKAIETAATVRWEEVTPFPKGEKTGIVSVTPVFDKGGRCTRLVGSVHDITDAKQAQAELNKAYEQSRSLASHLQDIREEERTTIAREIHDELGQLLTGLKMELSWLKKIEKLTPEQVAGRVQQASLLLDQCVQSVRTIAAELRPSLLDDLGLEEAIRWQAKEFRARTGIAAKFYTNSKDLACPSNKATVFFRVLQEALTNVARHADAKQVEIRLLHTDGNLTLSIADDGKGFQPKAGNTATLGLLGMKERMLAVGGEFTIHSTPGEGTTVLVSAPL